MKNIKTQSILIRFNHIYFKFILLAFSIFHSKAYTQELYKAPSR